MAQYLGKTHLEIESQRYYDIRFDFDNPFYIFSGGEPMRTEYSDDVTMRSSSILLDHETIKGKS